MIRRFLVLTVLNLAIASCQNAPLLRISERGYPREITGKDGESMVLVPGGEFLYGDDNQKLSLLAFYIDQYELSTRLYAAFVQATGQEEPGDWSQQVRW